MPLQLKNPKLFRQQCYIHGEWIKADDGKTNDVINPADGIKLGTVPDVGVNETRRAIEAAHNAFDPWKQKTAKERGQILRKWYELILQNRDDLAKIMTLEQGKPITESRSEITYGSAFIEWFAEEAKRAYGDVIPPTVAGQHLITIKQPVGVVAAITPWNFPHAMITRKCAPALAAGCTVVVKAPSNTPYSALALAELSQQAGIPAGVFNIITGTPQPIGLEMTTNPLVKKVSFTGSTATGKLLMQQSASTIKKLSLELGGNAPFIVFDDADLDIAVAGAIACKFRNTGQTCVCANRLLIQDKIYDAFSEKLMNAVKKLKVSNGLEDDSQLGPLISMTAVEKVEKHINDAVKKGAHITYGGKRHSLGGTFFEPTVLTHVTHDMIIAREETFGPVAPLFKFKDEKEAIALSNDTQFGLASYFYSRDIGRVWRVAENLEYGMVGINTGIISNEVAPFGGVKESGIGREGSKYGLEEFLEIKYLCMGA